MRVHWKFLVAIALGALLGASGCSNNTQGDDASPVFLTVNVDLRPLDMNVASNSFLQFQTVTLKSVLKVPAPTSTQFLDTRIDDYTIVWSRIDGGKVASPSETFGGNVLVPAGSSTTLNNYPFMSPSNLLRPPLDQLFPYNGGIDRETGNSWIREKGTVTFRGHTNGGQPVSGVGDFDMNFFYAPVAKRPGIEALALRPLAPSR